MKGKFYSQLSKSLGSLASWQKISNGISGKTTHGQFRLLWYNESIVRVSVTQEDEFEDFSYSLIAVPSGSPFQVEEHTDYLIVTSPKLVVSISKKNVRFKFLTADEKIINEDDPFFGTSWNGEQVTTYKILQDGERFIGLGEKTGPLDRKGFGYQNWNTDNFGYGTSADPLYCSTPFYIGIHHQLTYGIFFDNTHKSFFNFGASNNRFSSFSADCGEMNYYFIFGETVAEIIKGYTHLTGRMELPPLWSIGYQQCRYSYYPDKEVLSLAATFREKDIPADVIVFDIHYMDRYKIFTWSKRDFPDPKKLLQELKEKGFHVVLMCDPGIKIEEGYKAYESGKQDDIFIKFPDGSNYSGQVWPGWCHFPDFTNAKTRQWWQEQFKDYVALGVEGFWNDMNEVATWGNMLPENIELNFEGNKASMRRGRNIYGFQMARSTYEATKSLMNGKRPFNLTRSGFSGVQRYAAVWTGDNVAYDEHMILGVRMVNSMGLTGIAFAGYDVGGFVGDANTKLFARWISIGAFSPFFRGHSMINSRDSEPWSYGEGVEQIARNYIKFRYQLLPYIYSLFFEASQTGMPVQRSLAIDFTHDPKIYDGAFQNQYLFGPFILVVPVESEKEFVKVYLPEGEWYYLYDGKRFEGGREIILECPLHKLPVFIKSGALIPAQPSVQHTGEKSNELILHVYASKSNSSFTFYEDDGSTFDYQQDNFARKELEYRAEEKTLVLGRTEGNFSTAYQKIKLMFHGLKDEVRKVNVNKKELNLNDDFNSFFMPLEKFDPIHDPEPASREPVKVLTLDYTQDEIVISW